MKGREISEVRHVGRHHGVKASQVAQTEKNLPVIQETRVQSLAERSPGECSCYPLQYPWLKNSMDGKPEGSQRVLNSCNLFAGEGFEIAQELPKCDTEKASHQMLLEKWCQQVCSKQGHHKVSTCRNAIFAKHNEVNHNTTSKPMGEGTGSPTGMFSKDKSLPNMSLL